MLLRTASSRPRAGGERGYAMAALIVGIAIMGVMAAVALPVFSQAAQREKEAELVFRGEQYARAVGLFQRKMGPGTLPPNLDVLVDQKFLRRKYKDPVTGKDFRPLTMAEAQTSGANRPGGAGADGTAQGGGRTGAFQGAPGSSGLGGIPTGMTGVPGSGLGGGLGATPAGAGMGQSGLPGGGRGGPQGGAGGSLPLGSVGGGTGGVGGVGQPGQPVGGIVGVASTSTENSLRLYNGRSKYNEWAFVYNAPEQMAGGIAGAGGVGGAAGGIGGPGAGGPGAGRRLPGTPGSGPQPSPVSSPIGAPARPGQSTPIITNPGITGSQRR
ncbi:MAG: Tfp pilus assembly protein FimT/FimU [Vicinamibacterales bacterium]